jgi:hypothetical protein
VGAPPRVGSGGVPRATAFVSRALRRILDEFLLGMRKIKKFLSFSRYFANTTFRLRAIGGSALMAEIPHPSGARLGKGTPYEAR